MRIKLDFDDRLAFSTVAIPGLGMQQRTLVIKVGGKAFSVWLSIDAMMMLAYHHDDQYMREIDTALVATMEHMLTKILTDACAAVPEGVNLCGGSGGGNA